ncbi:predicted steroid reductase [Moesziomyces antarcticus T-34]|uniref:Predicted steroid reductase n=1 Tax=Pseudozyma antarctica (strain T-34) TaxID=1151754 RepID=M9M1H2_PSEA3|nr:predicted steroid reductase [Moesziomyces antarcticus T-34]
MTGTHSLWEHAALDPNTHLLPGIRSFWPAFTSYFHNGKALTHLATYKSYYASADPLHSAIAFCGFVSFYVWLMERITGNASQVDGLWTFLPLIYSVHFTVHKYFTYQPAKLSLFGGVESASLWDKVEPRLALMTLLSVLWSVRLTYNAIRRGMFKPGEEDYRWPLLRKTMSRPMWHIFSIFFIAIAQNILLAITALPNYLLLTTTSVKHVTEPVPRPVNQLILGDYILAALFVLNLTIQFFADQQQWNYQNYKRGKDPYEKPLPAAMLDPKSKLPVKNQTVQPYSTPDDARRGFVTKGLWAWSRHPNFACEQTTWWILYAFVPLTFLPRHLDFTHAHWSHFANYAILAPLAMNALFLPSTRYSEQVSAEKYPEYADYQKRVGMFLPIDTLLRTLYYNLIASKQDKHRVEANVWGTSHISKIKAN